MAKLEIDVPDELIDLIFKSDKKIDKKVALDTIKRQIESDMLDYVSSMLGASVELPKPSAAEKKLTKELNQIGKEILTDDIQAIAAAIIEQNPKPPRYQLTPQDFEKFSGVNIQAHASNPPNHLEQTLALYLINVTKGEAKRFTVTAALINLLGRHTQRIIYGTTTKAGTHQSKMILQWEREIRE